MTKSKDVTHHPGYDGNTFSTVEDEIENLRHGRLTQDFYLSGDISPTALSGAVDDYNPTGLSTAAVLRIDGGAADRNISGIVPTPATGSADGRILVVLNIGTSNALQLVDESASGSAAANRFTLGGANRFIPHRSGIILIYDTTSSRWRVPSPRFSAGNGLTGGSNTASFAIDTTVVATLNENTFTQQQGFPEATLTDAATISWNLQTQQCATVTLGGNRTLDTPSNMRAGYTYMLRVVQDGTGSRTLAYHADYLFPGGADPVLSTAAGAIDILSFYSNGSKMYGTILKAFA